MVVMDQFSRRIIGFSVHAGDCDGIVYCRMFNEAISRQGIPIRLSTDNDPIFLYHRWKANLRILGIEPVKSVPNIPVSHPFVERVIGSVRREFLDHTLFWNATDLKRKLDRYRQYFNQHRTHTSLGGQAPLNFVNEKSVKVVDLGCFGWETHCRGLFQLPIAG
jgi:putative transposase